MARAIKGIRSAEYEMLASRIGGDVERMPAGVVKTQLRYQLQVVESQIQMLAAQLGLDAEQTMSAKGWSRQPLDDHTWTSLASLSYLAAARETLRRTIATL
jgi:hypothetical protein